MAADPMNCRRAILVALSLFLAEEVAGKESNQLETSPPGVEAIEPTINPAPRPTNSTAQNLTSGPQEGNPLWAIPIRTLSATRERPLFSPSRRPPPPIVPAAANPEPAPLPVAVRVTPPEQPPWILVGTIVGEKDKFAFLFNVNSKAVIKLKEGGEEVGWRLKKVEFRSTVLEKGGRSVVLELPKPGQTNPTREATPGDQL